MSCYSLEYIHLVFHSAVSDFTPHLFLFLQRVSLKLTPYNALSILGSNSDVQFTNRPFSTYNDVDKY